MPAMLFMRASNGVAGMVRSYSPMPASNPSST